MKYNELQISRNKSRKRVGRGIAAGQGKTAGRGTKGQGSRTGKKLGPTFSSSHEHPLSTIPKARGFKSLRVKAQAVYTGHLNDVKGSTIDAMTLYEAGLVASWILCRPCKHNGLWLDRGWILCRHCKHNRIRMDGNW
jgi:large subunit ribosomal protein L15